MEGASAAMASAVSQYAGWEVYWSQATQDQGVPLYLVKSGNRMPAGLKGMDMEAPFGGKAAGFDGTIIYENPRNSFGGI